MSELSNKKILMVSYTSFIQKFYQTLPREIARAGGAAVEVLVPPYWKEIWSGGKKWLEKSEDPFYRLHVGRIFFPGNLHFAFFRERLASLLKGLQPDIIDLEDEPFNAGSFQMMWYRRRYTPGSKIVLHASQHQFKHYPPPFNWVERYVLKRADAILVRNSMARDVLLRKGYRGILEIVTHGVNTEAFAPREAPALRRELSSDGKPLVGYIGALAEHKGIDHLIRAIRGLPCRLLLVGDGPERESLSKLAGELQVDLCWRPPADHAGVAAYFNALDVFVLPSLTRKNWIEKFGRVLIEAMASGVPVIGSESGEIPRVLADAGWTFPEGDEPILREKITTLLNRPDLRQELADRGRRRAEQVYSWQAIAKQTVAVYERILGKK